MKFWLDGQLSPKIAPWMKSRFGVDCIHVRDLHLMTAEDLKIYKEARTTNAIVVTKDEDFVELSRRLGPPPQILWITCGNSSNQRLTEIFEDVFAEAMTLLKNGAAVVEISD